jgi:hypothetical protein
MTRENSLTGKPPIRELAEKGPLKKIALKRRMHEKFCNSRFPL